MFDVNLSPRLVPRVVDLYPGSAHVFEVNLGPIDQDIWNFAKAEGFAIVSKDSDFYRMSTLWGAPPKVVWLRVRNAGTAQVAILLRTKQADLLGFETDLTAALFIVST